MKLVLLPGFDGTGNFFADFIRHMPSGISCQVVSFPSDKPFGYEELARFVSQDLPEEDFVLLGESFSGPLCIKIAQRGPARLKGIILSGTFASRPLPKAMSAAARLILGTVGKINFPASFISSLLLNGKDSVMAEDIGKAVKSLPLDVFAKRATEALNVNATALLGDITVPVLILEAAQDRLLRRGTSPEIARACSKSELHKIKGPHLLLQQYPADAAFAVHNFINSLKP